MAFENGFLTGLFAIEIVAVESCKDIGTRTGKHYVCFSFSSIVGQARHFFVVFGDYDSKV
jgi:hypothetical protein